MSTKTKGKKGTTNKDNFETEKFGKTKIKANIYVCICTYHDFYNLYKCIIIET